MRRARALLLPAEAEPNTSHPLLTSDSETANTPNSVDPLLDNRAEIPSQIPAEQELLSNLGTGTSLGNNLDAVLSGAMVVLPQSQPELARAQPQCSILHGTQSFATQLLPSTQCDPRQSVPDRQSGVNCTELPIPSSEPGLTRASFPQNLPQDDVLSPATVARLLQIFREGKKISDTVPGKGKSSRRSKELEEEDDEDLSEEDAFLADDGVQYPPLDARNPFDSDNPNNLNRAKQYSHHFERFGLNEIEYPVNPTSMGDIEDRLKLKINVFSFFDDEGFGRYPLHISDKPYKREVDLLYWDEHFALITNFSGFLRDLTKVNQKIYVCKQCFGRHKTNVALQNHKPFCKKIDRCNQMYLLPDDGSTLKFMMNIRYQQSCPIVIYADFECNTVPIRDQAKGKNFYQEHKPISYAFKVVYKLGR